ncbi:hypothetical protein PsorP6_001662 [Peronosclerospora sorghi]|uniref:Uncharacterized protein n=1 Tax=Peronosclerospora sorghi TaxID=230839 RepID=A0ACC0WS96_9STRA|nr:hypothetical protein PsorP6_001662 [Peronosclerospora sorghi]
MQAQYLREEKFGNPYYRQKHSHLCPSSTALAGIQSPEQPNITSAQNQDLIKCKTTAIVVHLASSVQYFKHTRVPVLQKYISQSTR